MKKTDIIFVHGPKHGDITYTSNGLYRQLLETETYTYNELTQYGVVRHAYRLFGGEAMVYDGWRYEGFHEIGSKNLRAEIDLAREL